jgi:hypothetical protein
MISGAAGEVRALTGWLAALKRKRGARPRDKPFGRCLLDFLDQKTAHGLLPAELQLLDGCRTGADVNAGPADLRHKNQAETAKARYRAELRKTALTERKEYLWYLVSANRVRAGFLRFMILGGDEFAPIHETGIQLWNAWIDGDIDLRSGKCVSRVALTNCLIDGELFMQDARLDVLLLSGSWVRGFHANRATISGAMWLNGFFISDSEVELYGIEIGGRLDCGYGHFSGGIAAPGARIGGDLTLSGITANAPVSFVNADIGGSVFVEDVKLTSAVAKRTADSKPASLDLSRTKTRGNISFRGSDIGIAGLMPGDDVFAVDAQNIAVGGFVGFGGGFLARGEVCFNGAEIAKTLDFSGSSFHNEARFAIRAERANVAGAIKCQIVVTPHGQSLFEAFGTVSLFGTQCGELSCNGGQFRRPGGVALQCSGLTAAGSVNLTSFDDTPFRSYGQVLFHSAHIGKNLQCFGGRFNNKNGIALNCEASKITGSVFLGVGSGEYKDHDPVAQRRKRTRKTFCAIGTVRFAGAAIDQSVICTLGHFYNHVEDTASAGVAEAALDFSTARIGDTLFLGREVDADRPPLIAGSVDLSAATVRVLVDDGFIPGKKRGLKPAVDTEIAGGGSKPLQCTLRLDQFTYERLKGDRSCDPEMRAAWLTRQPRADLTDAFKPQPFEQLITVMRAMGYDDEADDIALFKRQTARQATPLIDIPEAGWRFPSQAAAVIAAAWLAIFGNMLILPFIMLSLLFRNLLAKLGEILLLDWFVGYGYKMARAVFLLLLLVFGFGAFYDKAFHQGAIVPADKDVRKDLSYCTIWTQVACPKIDGEAIPLFNPWLYSADVMVPVVTLGQKAAWVPAPDVAISLPAVGRLAAPGNLVYNVQLVETVLGWVEGFLLVSFVTGLISKDGGGKDQ